MSYDENSIQVLGQSVADERFGYTKILELSRAYPSAPTPFLQRLVEAAVMSGWGVEAAEAKYLRKSSSKPPPAEFTAIYAELMAQSRAEHERPKAGAANAD